MVRAYKDLLKQSVSLVQIADFGTLCAFIQSYYIFEQAMLILNLTNKWPASNSLFC